jgi:hypothetical protein
MATGHGMLINLHQIHLLDNYGEPPSHEPMRKAIGSQFMRTRLPGQDEICDVIIEMLNWLKNNGFV